MYLKYVQIRNYKNLKNVRFEFSKGVNTVIGENDSGKSNAMEALRILLDDDFYYNTKRLKETDFSEELDSWKGHWIIISAFFDEICNDDKSNEVCAEMIPEKENESFLRSYIRCKGANYGVVTLFIRPNRTIRKKLFEASATEEFESIRNCITLSDYEFYYTTRSQADFTDDQVYNELVGNFATQICPDPEATNIEMTGTKTDITNIWSHISLEFIDALRDASSELRKPKNPLRRIFDVVQADFDGESVEHIMEQIHLLNEELSKIPEIKNIGGKINEKLGDIVGLVYSPEIGIVSHMQEELSSVAKHLSLAPSSEENIEQLGLGHLNILYIALKLVEFEYYRNHEILNIMVIEEPEAHIHTHIQRSLFENLNVSANYTQVIMTTHSTHLSEVSNIRQMNVLKRQGKHSVVMNPANGLEEYGKTVLNIRIRPMETCLERYLDAKRSVLLFSKGVILVEGDGEEILIPALIKKGLGVTLDELGIGLINVGSVAFEYIASVFSEKRLQRYCAIITDSDSTVTGSKKSGSRAEELGVTRKSKFDKLFEKNQYVKVSYAPHTLEIDFYNEPVNRQYIKAIINEYYSDKNTIKKHTEAIDGSEVSRYDSVTTVLSGIGKGWHATMVAAMMDSTVSIPAYILNAISFAAQEVLTTAVLKKITLYILSTYEGTDNLINALKNSYGDKDILGCIYEAIDNIDNVNLRCLISEWEELSCDECTPD